MNLSTAMANYNVKREKYYGIHQAARFPNLWDEILLDGTNLSYIEAKQVLAGELAHNLFYMAAPTSDEDYQAEFRGYLEDVGITDLGPVEDLDEVLAYRDLANISDTGKAMVDFVDKFEHIFADLLEIEEADYQYGEEDVGFQLEIHYLGGAAHIWVVSSNFITEARECSPCIPNAGDLDTPCGSGEGFDFLCLPPCEYEDCELDSKPLVIREIDAKGHETGVQWKLNAEGTYDEYRAPALMVARDLDKALQEAAALLEKYHYQVGLQGTRDYDMERLTKAQNAMRNIISLVTTVSDGEAQAGSESLKVVT